MRVLTLFNDYRNRNNGEFSVVEATQELLRDHGIETVQVVRSSKGLDNDLRGKLRGFVGGFHSRAAYREVRQVLRARRPDLVHAHNLYPLLSPSVLVACRRAGVPTVMSLHNYGLTCPTWAHFRDGDVCTRCVDGSELSCVAHNCRGSFAESIGYALRATLARKLRVFHRSVCVFLVGSRFAKNHFVTAGFDAERIAVLPNMVRPRPSAAPAQGAYVAYAGRLAREKGISTLVAAARSLPDIDFRLAGEGPIGHQAAAESPPNARFLGFVRPAEMPSFYARARCVVVPSTWYEMSPLVVAEAMAQGVPVIASRIGGLPELIDDGVTGLLFEPGDAADLVRKIKLLHDSPELAGKMGVAARHKATRDWHPDRYFERLSSVYERARAMRPPSRSTAEPAAIFHRRKVRGASR